MSNNGMSIRSLLLLGGAAALVLSPDLRRRALSTVNEVLDGAHSLLDETIMPAAHDVAERASDLTEEARKRALLAQDELHEYLTEAQKEMERRRHVLLEEAEDTRKTLSKKAAKAQKEARKGLLSLQHDAHVAGNQLDKRTQKQIAGYQKDIARLKAEVERHAARNLHLADMQKHKAGKGTGALLPLALLVGAGVVIMVPSVRKSVENMLEGISPEAAGCLRKAGEVAGTFWIEDMPAPKPAAPAPAATPNPATTVSTPAVADTSKADTSKVDTSKDAPKTDAGKVDTTKPADDKKPDDKKPDDKKPDDKK